MTALFGIFAFVVVNIEKINFIQGVASCLGIVMIVGISYFITKYMLKLLNELEKMQ